MSDINVLINKIMKDAEEKRDAILKEASEEEKKIIAKKRTAAETEKNIRIEKAKAEAKLKIERIISSSKLEERNRKLAAKQQVITKVFQNAIKNLKVLPEDVYINYIKRSLAALDLKGDETIIISEKDKDKIRESFINEVNNSLVSEGKAGNLKLASFYGNFAGGFIIEKSGIELNYTFEALLSSMKDELEYEVANLLF